MPPSLTVALTDDDIARIATGVIDRTLPKSEWTHAAHFAAAVWVLTRPDMDAARDMPGLIRAYNTATGVANTDTEGYHETITLASIRAAAPGATSPSSRPPRISPSARVPSGARARSPGRAYGRASSRSNRCCSRCRPSCRSRSISSRSAASAWTPR